MSDKPLEVEEIISVLKELDIRKPDIRFCLFNDGTGRIDQGGTSKAIESWVTIEELTERIRSKTHGSKRDRVVKEAVAYCKDRSTKRRLHEAVWAFLNSEPKDKEPNDDHT